MDVPQSLVYQNLVSDGEASNTHGSENNLKQVMKEGLACNFDFLEDELITDEIK